MHSLNCQIARATDKAPFELVFGQKRGSNIFPGVTPGVMYEEHMDEELEMLQEIDRANSSDSEIDIANSLHSVPKEVGELVDNLVTLMKDDEPKKDSLGTINLDDIVDILGQSNAESQEMLPC